MIVNSSGLKLVCGVGTNDAEYVTQKGERVAGKYRITWKCPFYRAWQNMLTRCYSAKYQEKWPTYIGCTVCNEWLVFTAFKTWMQSQNWNGSALDKDIIKKGSKIYSAETCAFIDRSLNSFLNSNDKSQGSYLLGASWISSKNRFRSSCCNPFSGRREILGYFTSEIEAHEKWKSRKRQHAAMYASMQKDERIANSLLEMAF